MKKVERYVTSDGQMHDNLEKATWHADERFGKKLTSIARELAVLTKYLEFSQYLEDNLDKFKELLELQKDTDLQD